MNEEEIKAELSIYTGWPRCMDCKWKLGTTITENCSCMGSKPGRNPETHVAALNRAQFLQGELERMMGRKGYHEWVCEEYDRRP